MNYFLTALAIGIFVFACAALPGCDQWTKKRPVDTVQLTQDTVAGPALREIKLSDGTRCAVVFGVRGNAISCGWKED